MPGCDPSRCVVMFPSEDALLPDQLDLQHLERVVIIDSKWYGLHWGLVLQRMLIAMRSSCHTICGTVSVFRV